MKLPPIAGEHFKECSLIEVIDGFNALEHVAFDPDGLAPIELAIPLNVQIAVQSAICAAAYTVPRETRRLTFSAYWYAHNAKPLSEEVFSAFWDSVRSTLFDIIFASTDL